MAGLIIKRRYMTVYYFKWLLIYIYIYIQHKQLLIAELIIKRRYMAVFKWVIN
jgi:hypothetical protein